MRKSFQILMAAVISVGAFGGCSSPNQAADSSAVEMATITYRVTGAVRGIVGSYTDSSGNEVAIPTTENENGVAYAPMPWQKDVQLSVDFMHKRHLSLFLSAHDAFNSGTAVNVEILANGKSYNYGTGVSPRISIYKH